jgi:hypothetical protein
MESITLTDTTTKQTQSISETAYYSDSSSSRQLLGIWDATDVITYLPSTTPDTLPTSVNIGDQGTFGTYVDSDGDSISETWQITDAGNDKINRIVSTTTKDGSGNIIGSGELTEVIDKSYNIDSMVLSEYIASSNDTLTLSGN